MKSKILLAAVAPTLLGACATVFGPTSPFAVDRKGELVEFNYAWSAEASRSPLLVRRLRADLEQAFASTAAAAEADRASAKATARPFRGHVFSRRWTTSGQSSRLLSLEGRTNVFTGGAHANYGSTAILWDRRAARAISIDSLLSASKALANVHKGYCNALDAERRRRRSAAPANNAAFGPCPDLSQLTMALSDRDSDRRFDTLRLIADPYVAGPFSDGFFIIDRSITAEFLGAIKPGFRSDFEVGQPQ